MPAERILVATDFSEHAELALRRAYAVGGPTAKYRLVHVMPLLLANVRSPLLRAKDRAVFADADEKAVSETKKALAALVEKHKIKNASIAILHGSVSGSIAKEAKDWKATLVVLGAGDHSKVERLLMGSQARSILRAMPTDALVVRDAGPKSEPPYRRILLATDFAAAAAAAARRVRQWADEWHAKVTVAHAVDPAVWWQGRADVTGLAGVGDATVANRYQTIMQELLGDFTQEHFHGRAPESKLIVDRPTEGLLKLAQECNADLVVVGTHGPKFVERFFMGSVAYGVATQARQDALVVRQPAKAKRRTAKRSK